MNVAPVRFQMPQSLLTLARGLAFLGVAGLVLGLVLAPESAWAHLLLVGFLGVGFGLAGALLIALQFVTGAGWSVSLRRVPEALVAVLPVGSVLVLLALVAAPSLYPWTASGFHAHGAFQHFWLNWPFFLGRAVVYVVIWSALATALVWISRRQDADGQIAHTHTLRRLSALFLVVFSITFWLASTDWLMSREPHWVSTIFGLYNFAGLFTSGLAVYIVLTLALANLGPYRGVLTEQQRHDLGKLLFGISTFWAYLWYCQYMLIWYVNLPEETPYYITRLQGVLEPLFWINLVLNWVIPFFALISRPAKLSTKVLLNVSLIILLGRWLDLYLMILPPGEGFVSVLLSLTITLGALGLYFLAFAWSLGRAALIPVGDPYLVECLPAAHGDGQMRTT